VTSVEDPPTFLQDGLFRGVTVPHGDSLSIEALIETGYEQPWSDGMPLAPLDLGLVGTALQTLDRSEDAIVGTFPDGPAVSVRDVAVGTVLAGGAPEYLPVVLAAAEAFFVDGDARVAARGSNGQCVIVNGPVAQELDINGHFGAFGPGWRANATIGRALSLLVVAGAGRGPSPFGDPSKYTFCFAEDLGDSSWTPLHVNLGFPAESSTVTLHSVRKSGRNFDRGSRSPEAHVERWGLFLRDDVGATHWEEDKDVVLVLVVSQDWRRQLSDAGWSKDDLRAALYPTLVAPPSPAGSPLRLAEDDLTIISAGGPAEATGWALVGYGIRPAVRLVERA
jgi:hypothetical protein